MSSIEELRSRYIALAGARPASIELLDGIEQQLQVKLPSDFREICDFFDGGGMDVLPLFSLAGNAPQLNPLHETLRCRETIGIPSNFLVLAEPPESLVILDCFGEGRVLWVDAVDASRIVTGKFTSKPNIWPSFANFFSYLLDEEEAERG